MNHLVTDKKLTNIKYMSIIYCFKCEKNIDTDYEVEHCSHREIVESCEHCIDCTEEGDCCCGMCDDQKTVWKED